MTYLKTALASCAALALAAPALAGDGHMKKKNYDAATATQTTVISTTSENRVMSATETRDVPFEKINDTVGEILQADGEPSIQSDGEVVMADGHTVDADILRVADDGMTLDNAIAVPGSNNTVTTVMCPAGTTAQVDMTCLITGDYDAELVGPGEMVKTD